MLRFSRPAAVAVLSALVAGCAAPEPDSGAGREPVGQSEQRIDATPLKWPTDLQWVAPTAKGVPVGDPAGDAQGSRDVVGDAAHPAAFVWADAAHMYFRVRIGSDMHKTATTLQPFGWGCVFDTDGDPTMYELFANVNGIVQGDIVQLLQNTVKKLDDPKDTCEVTLLNGVNSAAAGYTPLAGGTVVNATEAHARIDAAGTTLGGGADWFISFAIDLNDLPANGWTPAKPFRLLCGTSNAANNLSADLVAAAGVTTLSGAFSDPLVCDANGCKVACTKDAECSAAQYCDTGASLCKAKLPNGTAMPTVPGHTPVLDGTCTQGAGAAVCAAGVCDTKDAKCGYADGDGTCTAQNAAVVCRSGNCVSGVCAPPPACAKDADCTATQFCDTGTTKCAPKLPNGTAVPTVPNHAPVLDGKCAQGVGAAVCLAGVCDTKDDLCGFASGDGACTAQDAAVVCRSGACSVSGACNYPNGCLVDGDCGATEWCDTGAHKCAGQLPNGGAIPNVPSHTPVLDGTCTQQAGVVVCLSDVCDPKDSKCGLGNGSGTCSVANQATVCRSAVCDGADQKCGWADGHGTCDAQSAATVCRSGACSAKGACAAAGTCLVDADCGASDFCNTETSKCEAKKANGVAVPTIAGHDPALDGTCTQGAGSAVCASGVCDAADNLCGYADFHGTSDDKNAATVCRSGLCLAGVCAPAGACAVDADCAASQYCQTDKKTCAAKKANGEAIPTVPGHAPTLDGTCTPESGKVACLAGVCSADGKCGYANGDGACKQGDPDGVCRSKVCDLDGKCGYADGSGPCSAADAASVCRSGACSAGAKVCIPKGGCLVDGDCAKAEYCDTGAKLCAPKKANGEAIPTVAGHSPKVDGKCTAAVAKIVCASGVCDPIDDKCGLATGDGPCDEANGATVCRSGQCSVSLVCAPIDGCIVDGDCKADQFCNTATSLCSDKLPNGAAIPSLPGHQPAVDGKCTGDAAKTVCASGVCDPKDDACGYDDGSGPCSPTNAVDVCRSQACGADGTCAPLGACSKDAECAASQYCDTGASKCAPKKPNGQAIPKVPGHVPAVDGACTKEAAAVVCLSAVCDPGDGLCGLGNGLACGGAAECRSGVCNADGLCGDPNGTPCTDPATCRSGVCNADGRCGDPDGALCASPSTCRSGTCEGGQCGANGLEIRGGGACAVSHDEDGGDALLSLIGLGAVVAIARRRRGAGRRAH